MTDNLTQLLHQALPGCRLAHHQPFCVEIVTATTALDSVRGERKGCTTKTDERNVTAIQFLTGQPDCFQRKPEAFLRWQDAQCIYIGAVPDGIMNNGNFALAECQL